MKKFIYALLFAGCALPLGAMDNHVYKGSESIVAILESTEYKNCWDAFLSLSHSSNASERIEREKKFNEYLLDLNRQNPQGYAIFLKAKHRVYIPKKALSVAVIQSPRIARKAHEIYECEFVPSDVQPRKRLERLTMKSCL